MEEWRYRATYSWPLYWTEDCGQLYAPPTLSPVETAPGPYWAGGWGGGGPKGLSGGFGEKKNLLQLSGIELWFVHSIAHRSVTIPTELLTQTGFRIIIIIIIIISNDTDKRRSSPWNRPRRPRGGLQYISTLSLTSALDVVVGQRHAPAVLLPGKTRYPF